MCPPFEEAVDDEACDVVGDKAAENTSQSSEEAAGADGEGYDGGSGRFGVSGVGFEVGVFGVDEGVELGFGGDGGGVVGGV